MWETRPNHRIEDDPGPVVWNEDAIFHDIARWHLHPAVVDHDPERRKRGPQRDHGGGKQIEPWRHAAAAKNEDAEEAGLSVKPQKVSNISNGPSIDRTFSTARSSWCRTEIPITIPDTTADANATMSSRIGNRAINQAAGGRGRGFGRSRQAAEAVGEGEGRKEMRTFGKAIEFGDSPGRRRRCPSQFSRTRPRRSIGNCPCHN